MDATYKPDRVEAEAREYWEKQQTFRVTEDPSREKYYCLSMFPYPSGRRRCHQPLSAHAGKERPAADGLGCLWPAG